MGKLKKSKWYRDRPDVIKKAIDMFPPDVFYRMKSGKQCYIYSYEEPGSGRLDDVTVTVQLTGKGGPLAEFGFGMLDSEWQVFGVDPKDMEKWTDDEFDVHT